MRRWIPLFVALSWVACSDRDVPLGPLDGVGDAGSDFVTATDAEDDFILPIDPGSPGIDVVPSVAEAVEAGKPAYFVVTLRGLPTADVVVDLEPSLPEQVMLPATLTFTPEDWHVRQIVAVTAVDDIFDDPEEASPVLVTTTVSSEDAAYDGMELDDFTVDIVDNDYAALAVNPTSATLSEGESIQVLVQFDAEPVGDLVVTVTPDDEQVHVDATELEFADNGVARFTILAVEDDDVELSPHATGVTLRVTGGDPSYEDLDPMRVELSVVDTDAPVILMDSNRLLLTEEGDTSRATVRFSVVKPAPEPVTIEFANSDPARLALSSDTLTLSAADSSADLTISVVAHDRPASDEVYTISAKASVLGDPRFAELPVTDLEVTVVDNDTAGIDMSPADFTLMEEEGSQEIAVLLTAEPLADVAVSFASSDVGSLVVVPTTLTFTPGNWDTAQTVMAQTIRDFRETGNKFIAVEASSASMDPFFNELFASSECLFYDRDHGGFALSTSAATLNEGESVTIDIDLLTIPYDDVVLSFTPNDAAQISVSPTSLTFFKDVGPYARRSVTITALDDDVAEPTNSYWVQSLSRSNDSPYDYSSARSITLTVLDDD